MSSDADSDRLGQLIGLFFPSAEAVGTITGAAASDMPDDYRRLLDHQEHMTVAVEAYHESLVDVDVLSTEVTDTHYAREILLRRQRDNAVVQWGIMKIHLPSLTPEVRAEIEEQHRPLGRILVRHNFLRTIHLDALWKIEPGADLCQHFGMSEPQTIYGRTADIHLDGQPAVEVLEVVAPV